MLTFLQLGCTLALPESVVHSAVVWPDADFKDELGSMPIGNGDIAANVWVENTTGDLLFYLAKSDAFDQNSQPIKVGRFRLSFDPPLWNSSRHGKGADGFKGPVYNTIGGQGAGKQIMTPNSGSVEWPCSSQTNCAVEASKMCDSIAACHSFSCRKTDDVNNYQLHTTGIEGAIKHKTDWNFFYRSGPATPTPPPTPSPFEQKLNLVGGAIDIRTTDGYSVKVFVDANEPVMRIQAVHSKSTFSITAALEIYRKEKQKTQLGRGFCNPYYDIPDVLVNRTMAGSGGTVTWYHRNDYAVANAGQPSMYEWSMNASGVDPTVIPDPFKHLTFGGTLRSADDSLSQDATNPAAISGRSLNSSDVTVTLFSAQSPTIDAWLASLDVEEARTTKSSGAALPAHEAWWGAFWNRSSINMPMRGSDPLQALVESQYVYSRYLDACDGRGAKSAIKFNGQAFTVDMGKGPDARDWGACYWFQNTRQPYYNALAAGDLDIMRPLYEFYNRSIPAIKARVASQFAMVTPAVTGGVWPETMTSFGMYNEGDWGCSTSPHGVTARGDSSNTYIRFHFTGSLELALMTLDDFTMTGDTAVLESYAMPICNTVLEFFRTRFPHKDPKTGKTDLWPSQALETHQCPDPGSRSACATNPSTDVAGLKAVLTRLVALPELPFISTEMRAQWGAQLALLPSLPFGDGKILPVMPGYAEADHNSENTELYAVHPFRLYGMGKPGLEQAQATYAARKHKCNSGWCQGIIDAAMLNQTEDAKSQVVSRAAVTSMFRFRGFAGHMQDYEPSLDHFAFMRTGMHYMLLQPVDDAKQSVLLFPAWPAEWDVDVKLHAPLSTTIEAACINGTLTKFIVTPKSREADITIMNCRAI